MASSALFNSPVQLNFFGYRIVDNINAQIATNVTASFRYRGYEIAFSTFDPAGSKVIVLCNKVLVDEYGTVEAAITAINEMMGWRGAANHVRDRVSGNRGNYRR